LAFVTGIKYFRWGGREGREDSIFKNVKFSLADCVVLSRGSPETLIYGFTFQVTSSLLQKYLSGGCKPFSTCSDDISSKEWARLLAATSTKLNLIFFPISANLEEDATFYLKVRNI
jgi:hypothetical protein